MSTITTTFNYVAPSPDALVSAAVFEGTAISKFNKLYNIRNSTEITTLSGTPALQGFSCTFNPQTGRALTPRTLTPVYHSLQDSICINVAYKLVQSNSDDLIDNVLGEFLTSDLLKKLSRIVDARLFVSATSSSGDWAGATPSSSGIFTLALADGSTVKDTSTASITTANAIDRYNAFYNLAPNGVKYSPEHYTFLSMADIITFAQASLTTSGAQKLVEKVGDNEWVYTVNPNNRLIPVNGLVSGQMLMTTRENLWCALDTENTKIVVARTNPLDDRIGMKVDFQFAANYGISSDVIVRAGV